MEHDPIVREIHQIREKLSKKFQYNIQKIFEDEKKKEKEHQAKVVNLKAKFLKKLKIHRASRNKTFLDQGEER
jgi:hypothetical protein